MARNLLYIWLEKQKRDKNKAGKEDRDEPDIRNKKRKNKKRKNKMRKNKMRETSPERWCGWLAAASRFDLQGPLPVTFRIKWNVILQSRG